MKRVLFVEDDDGGYFSMTKNLQEIVERFRATSCESALQLFHASRSIILAFDAIVWDGEVNDGLTFKAIKEVRDAGFTGPMIAASSNSDWRREQLDAGCDHEVIRKSFVPQKLAELLGLTLP